MSPGVLAVCLVAFFGAMCAINTVWSFALSVIALHAADRLDRWARPQADWPLSYYVARLAIAGFCLAIAAALVLTLSLYLH